MISLFNEVIASIYLYLLMSLTDYNPLREDIGFALMVVVVIAVAVNLIKAIWLDLKWVGAIMKGKLCMKKGE